MFISLPEFEAEVFFALREHHHIFLLHFTNAHINKPCYGLKIDDRVYHYPPLIYKKGEGFSLPLGLIYGSKSQSRCHLRRLHLATSFSRVASPPRQKRFWNPHFSNCLLKRPLDPFSSSPPLFFHFYFYSPLPTFCLSRFCLHCLPSIKSVTFMTLFIRLVVMEKSLI